jgi:hypothetical protein
MNVLQNNQKFQKENSLNIDELLAEVSIMEADEVENKNLEGWYAVFDTDGINAFFSTEKEALAYRLFLINRILND